MSKGSTIAGLVIIGCVIASGLTVSQNAPAEAKGRRQARPGYYLVPPPPAYMPSILPELKGVDANGNPIAIEPPKPKNPYKKYVFTAEGYDDPLPTTQRKGVSYWNPGDKKSN
jgi:hypothetical protein